MLAWFDEKAFLLWVRGPPAHTPPATSVPIWSYLVSRTCRHATGYWETAVGCAVDARGSAQLAEHTIHSRGKARRLFSVDWQQQTTLSIARGSLWKGGRAAANQQTKRNKVIYLIHHHPCHRDCSERCSGYCWRRRRTSAKATPPLRIVVGCEATTRSICNRKNQDGHQHPCGKGQEDPYNDDDNDN